MKKIMMMLVALILVVSLSACGGKEKLYVLNWGEYMDSDLIAAFEDEFNVEVVYEELGSNEEMEIKVKSGQTPYDIVIPSDYMIDKLRQQDLLHEIDHSKLSALNDVSFLDDVLGLYEDKPYAEYMIPYFWGTIGIMYNTNTVSAEDLTGWDVLFESGDELNVGMYDSSRDAVAAALLYLGYDVNTADEAKLNEAKQALIDGAFAQYGEDGLKGKVIEENLDLALVYSGDYFDELYVAEEEEREINFGFFVPETTNVWIDAFVIPTTSENTDMAYEFINFFLTEENAEQNSDWVGYASVLTEVYATLTDPDGDYGYDYENYNPMPEGSARVMYEFVSDERYDLLSQILNAAKAAE